MFFKMEHCDVYYGQIQAMYDINVEINPGEIISIIGASSPPRTARSSGRMKRSRPGRPTISSSAASAMSPRAVRSSRA